MRTIQKIGLAAAIVILAGMNFMPVTDLLPMEARNMLGVLLAVLILLVTEVFPLGITCLAALSLMVIFGCAENIASAASGYTNKVLYFVVASFGISEALTIVPTSKRILVGLMTAFGKNSTRLLFAIMLCTALLSSIISNVAAAAVFIPIILKFLDVYDKEEDRKRTGRCYMIALPVASMIGGMMTPAGSSINMIAISLLQKNADITITFIQWMAFGIPLAAVSLPVAWFLCTRVYKPAALEEKKIRSYLEEIRVREPIGAKEMYVIVIVVVMLVLWILSSWYPVFDVTVVALIGLLLFFVPGFQVLTWADFRRCVSWEAFFLIGTMISMGGVITQTGLSVWISSVVFPTEFTTVGFLAAGFTALLTFVLLVPIPVAPALVTMLAAPLIGFAMNVGVSPYMLMITLGLCAGNCYLLPLDTVPLMTFSTGYYRMFDMPKATVWLQLFIIIFAAVWIPLVAGFFAV